MTVAGHRRAAAALCEAGLSATAVAGVAGAEVVVDRRRGGLTRFANSAVHQNVVSDDVSVAIRVLTDDGRVGVARAHTADPDEVAPVAASAVEAARASPVTPDFPGFSPPLPAADVPFDEATANASPGDRAVVVRALLGRVPTDLSAAGAYETGDVEVAVATSEGQWASSRVSHAELTLVVTGPSSSGYAQAGGRTSTAVDPVAVADSAVGKARAGADPDTVAPGDWPVVLEPAAVTTLVEFLALLGFGARDVLEGRSFVAGRRGERVVHPSLTLVEDVRSPGTVGLPFDHEGTPRQRVDLIRDGVASDLVHDRHTARRMGVMSTGHALPAPNPRGPAAAHPRLLPGDDGHLDDLVARVEHGLLVTRFHYVNVVHPLETRLTGMTRDGTFLIADGRIGPAVRNLRFTASVLDVLNTVEAVSTATGYGADALPGKQMPAVSLARFPFTGSTTFG